MAIIQSINLSSPDDGQGDSLRVGGLKINENTSELFGRTTGNDPYISTGDLPSVAFTVNDELQPLYDALNARALSIVPHGCNYVFSTVRITATSSTSAIADKRWYYFGTKLTNAPDGVSVPPFPASAGTYYGQGSGITLGATTEGGNTAMKIRRFEQVNITIENGVVTGTSSYNLGNIGTTSFVDAVNNSTSAYTESNGIIVISATDDVGENYYIYNGIETLIGSGGATVTDDDFTVVDPANSSPLAGDLPVNLTEVQIKDENDVLQFDVTDQLLFENFSFDIPLKKIIAPKSAANTFFGGMETVWTTKEELGASLVSVNEDTLSISSAWTSEEIEKHIQNFKIEDGEISCTINKPYAFQSGFGRPTIIGETMTYLTCYGGFYKRTNFQDFRGSTNLQRVFAKGFEIMSSSTFQNISTLTSFIAPECTSVGGLDNCNNLQYIQLPKANYLNSVFNNRNNLISTEIKQFDFSNVISLGLDCFAGTNLTSIHLPNLKTVINAAFQNNSVLTEVILPKLEVIESTTFNNSDSLTSIDLPSLKKVGDNPQGGLRAFGANSLQYLNIPNCKKIAQSPSTLGNAFLDIGVGCVINVNEVLRTADNGNPDADIVYARDVRNCIINYISDNPQSFKNEDIDITSTYADDAAAATGGIDIGKQYVRTTGITAVRLT